MFRVVLEPTGDDKSIIIGQDNDGMFVLVQDPTPGTVAKPVRLTPGEALYAADALGRFAEHIMEIEAVVATFDAQKPSGSE